MPVAMESLECCRPLNVTLLQSSRTVGWTSLLVDLHRVEEGEAEFETCPTPDQTIVAQLGGETDVESHRSGAWRRTVYQAGTVGLTPPRQVDRLRRRPRARSPEVRKANLYLPQVLLDEAWDELRRAGQRTANPVLNALAFQDEGLVQAIRSFVAAAQGAVPDLYAASAARWLAVHLQCFHAGRLEPDRLAAPTQTITDRRIARVLEFMAARLADPPSLEELATEAGVSKFHFTRLFRRKTGLNPHAYLMRLRMDAARSMLSSTDLHVGAVATLCGFKRGAELSRAFAAQLGMSPTCWRTRSRDRNA